ncbi:hypothetical protein ENKO_090 [Klebsiella phage fENko-Kae01]|nr:hypothetical protein [Klebsiella phage fENko-Kae01]
MIQINGIELPEQCTVLEGLTYIHVYFKNLSISTKKLLESLQDEEVSFTFSEDDLIHEYPCATIIYLGNNTLYVCSSMTKE